MALAGLNHKLAGHNLSAHDITGILIGSIYVGVRFPAHDSMIFRNGLVAFFCPAKANQTLAAAGVESEHCPRTVHLGLLFFLAVSSGFLTLPPIAPMMVLPCLAIFFTARRQNS